MTQLQLFTPRCLNPASRNASTSGTFLAKQVILLVVKNICMWFELLILVIGIAFGYLRKGKEDFWGLLKTGAIIGIILAVLFGLVAFLFAPGAIGLGLGLAGGFGIFIGVILLVIIFLAGAFIGDWLEGMQKKKSQATACCNPSDFCQP